MHINSAKVCSLREELKRGARLAEPGEFTKRALLNGKMDLIQAEAVSSFINAQTEIALDAAQRQREGTLSKAIGEIQDRLIQVAMGREVQIDFVDDAVPVVDLKKIDIQVGECIESISGLIQSYTYGRMLKEGFEVSIIGKPNVGKSSLFNALLGQNRSIISDMPGTTRDIVSEWVNLYGFPVKLIDSVGVHETSDQIEREGIDRAIAASLDAHFRPACRQAGMSENTVSCRCSQVDSVVKPPLLR